MKTADQLVDLYFTSVGRNSKLLLNVPPTRAGLLHATDVSRLAGMRQRLTKMFGENLAGQAKITTEAFPEAGNRFLMAIDLGRTRMVWIADLREDISRGQVVTNYVLDGQADDGWRELAKGTTIGYRTLDRFAPTRLRRLRLTIDTVAASAPGVRLRLYAGT